MEGQPISVEQFSFSSSSSVLGPAIFFHHLLIIGLQVMRVQEILPIATSNHV